MNVDKAFSSNFLKATDIEDMADDSDTAVVTIARVEMTEVGQDQQQKPVVYFKGIDPGLILNKTNATTIAGIHGKETDNWTGKTIGLFATEVEYQGKQMLGIRVRLKAPKVGRAPMPVVDEAEIPF